LLSVTVLLITGSHPSNAISFVFRADTVKLFSVIISFNSYGDFCTLSYVLDSTTLSSEKKKKNCVNSWFFGSGIPFMSSFCHLVIILSKYIVRSVDDRGQPCRTPLLISASLDGWELKLY
jgi:hypothetical protein